MNVDIEIFTSTVCNNCQRTSRMVEQLLNEPGFASITWREVDVVEEIDHAVSVGVLATPSISIGGKLTFTASPSSQQLYQAIKNYLAKRTRNGE